MSEQADPTTVLNAARELYELLDLIINGQHLWDYRTSPGYPQAPVTAKLEHDAERALEQYRTLLSWQ